MAKGFLIDTNTLIYFLKAELPNSGFLFVKSILDTAPTISFVTQIELLGYPTISGPEEADAMHVIQSSSVILINSIIIEETILLRKKHSIKLPDAIIAATALVNDLTIITANEKDFLKIQGLDIINPTTI